MNVEIGTETPIILFWEYLFRKFGILSLQCRGEDLCLYVCLTGAWSQLTSPDILEYCRGQWWGGKEGGKEISSIMTAGVNYLALYMITPHLSEYLGVEESEKEDMQG